MPVRVCTVHASHFHTRDFVGIQYCMSLIWHCAKNPRPSEFEPLNLFWPHPEGGLQQTAAHLVEFGRT
jgi:hypothetical protein